MSFALVVDTITQTGTDTPSTVLSGIGAISGVTTVSMGQYTKLIIPYKLIISGNMTIDKSVKLSFERGGGFVNEVTVNGTFTAKHVRTDNGTNDYYAMPSMDFNNTASVSYNGSSNNSIIVVGGTLDFANIQINADGGQYWNGGTIKYRRVVLNAQNVTTPNDNQFSTQAGTPTIDWDDVTIIGGSIFIRDATITNLLNYKPRYMIAGFGQGFGVSRTLVNFAPFGNQNDVSVYSTGALFLTDPAPGGAQRSAPGHRRLILEHMSSRRPLSA